MGCGGALAHLGWACRFCRLSCMYVGLGAHPWRLREGVRSRVVTVVVHERGSVRGFVAYAVGAWSWMFVSSSPRAAAAPSWCSGSPSCAVGHVYVPAVARLRVVVVMAGRGGARLRGRGARRCRRVLAAPTSSRCRRGGSCARRAWGICQRRARGVLVGWWRACPSTAPS